MERNDDAKLRGPRQSEIEAVPGARRRARNTSGSPLPAVSITTLTPLTVIVSRWNGMWIPLMVSRGADDGPLTGSPRPLACAPWRFPKAGRAARLAGARRFWSRSLNSGRTSFENSSIEEHSISCGILPACERQTTWSMPTSSNSRNCCAKPFRRADAILGASLRRREFVGMVLEFVPDIGFARLVLAEEAVVAQPVNEESVALRADLFHPCSPGRTGTGRRWRIADSPRSRAARTHFRTSCSNPSPIGGPVPGPRRKTSARRLPAARPAGSRSGWNTPSTAADAVSAAAWAPRCAPAS